MSESLREQIAQAALEWRYIGLSWANARQADREHFTELADAVLPVVEAEIEKVCEREQNTEGTLRARLAEVRRERDDLEVSLATVAAGFERARARVAELERERRERDEFWIDMLSGIKVLIEAHLDPVLSVASGAWQVNDRDRLRQVLAELDALPGLGDEWKSENCTLHDEVDRLRAALREVHDRSLLPFDDNDRRWIGERARAALLGAPGGES